MTEDSGRNALEEAVPVHLLYPNARVHGLVAGLLGGGATVVATNRLALRGGAVEGPHRALHGRSFIGRLIGFAYGLVAGYGAARLSNAIVALREGR